MSALAGLMGNALAGQVAWGLAVWLVMGAVPGLQLGAWLSKRLSARSLRYGLACLTTLLAMRLWADLILNAQVARTAPPRRDPAWVRPRRCQRGGTGKG